MCIFLDCEKHLSCLYTSQGESCTTLTKIWCLKVYFSLNVVNVYTSAHNHKLKYRVTNTAKACILVPFTLSPILRWKPGHIKQCHPASQQWQSPICPLDDSPCLKAPASTQTHTSHFPPKWASCFLSILPGVEGREVAVIVRNSGQEQREEGAG